MNINTEQLEQYFRILGCEPGTALADIKKEYRNLAQVFHPDKYEAGSTRQEWAANRLIQINNAYEKLKEFFSEYPDGIPPQGWRTRTRETQAPNETTYEKSQEDSDGFLDWQAWESQSQAFEDISLSEWTKQQESRQEHLKKDDSRNNRGKTVFYGKIAVAAFVCLLWIGRAGSSELTKSVVETERQGLVARQEYEREHQGATIDGLAWTDQELDSRHQDEFNEFVAKNEQRSKEAWTSGIATSCLTLFVLWLLLSSKAKDWLSAWKEGKSHETN